MSAKRIDWPDLQWTVLIDVHDNECVAEFKLMSWVIAPQAGTGDQIGYWPAGQSSAFPETYDPAAAEIECSGSVKWDGCVNFQTDPDCALHSCGRDDVVNFTRALLRACDEAFGCVPKRDPEMWK